MTDDTAEISKQLLQRMADQKSSPVVHDERKPQRWAEEYEPLVKERKWPSDYVVKRVRRQLHGLVWSSDECRWDMGKLQGEALRRLFYGRNKLAVKTLLPLQGSWWDVQKVYGA